MKVIYTSKNEEIYVSDEDYPLLSRHSWDLNTGGYARTSIGNKHILMHKLICPSGKGPKETDHVNRNRLDNRRENLRVVSRSANRYNTGKHKGATPYLGVYMRKDGSFYGTVNVKTRVKHVPKYKGEPLESVAKARDYVMHHVFGAIPVLNFPEEDYENFSHPKLDHLNNVIAELKRWRE